MFTVFLNSEDEGHNLESFEDKMTEICDKHKRDKRALAFAFIVYDFNNPNLWKVLNDNEYWMALNDISGKYLTVFSLNYKEEQKQQNQSNSHFDGMQYMTSINTSEHLSSATNKLIKKYFGNVDITFPSVLFFQVNENEITDSLIIQLEEETVEQSFLELKEYIGVAVGALRQIKDENRGNYDVIFDQLTGSVKAKKSNLKVKRVRKKFGSVIGLIAAIKGLF
jgi:hypothetical protein